MIHLRKSNKNKVREKLKISDLPKNREHVKTLLDVYLDPSFERRVGFKHSRGLILEAFGTGFDGERQSLLIWTNGRGARFFINKKGERVARAPFEEGKVFYLLKQLGYELKADFTRIACRYRSYINTGISHLDIRNNETNIKER